MLHNCECWMQGEEGHEEHQMYEKERTRTEMQKRRKKYHNKKENDKDEVLTEQQLYIEILGSYKKLWDDVEGDGQETKDQYEDMDNEK